MAAANKFGVTTSQHEDLPRVIQKILTAQAEEQGQVWAEGILEIVDDGYGFVRRNGLLPSADDVYVPSPMLRRLGLRQGDTVGGVIRAPREGEKFWGMLRVEIISGTDPESARRRPHFGDLTPIHPIGHTNRKGRNNALKAEPGDPGSPYAIGAEEGGHDAIHPELGTFDDFRAFVDAAKVVGIEVALDIAVQCSPDHPWLKQHPDWFRRRPDGSMKYAENPPKKYEDIVNPDFGCDDAGSLWNALRDVILFWVGHGVKIFRVDNPHTKPLRFWEWLIREVQLRHPDVLFLAEAFTRPKLMKGLAKLGFSQSYTYFTWRTQKWEIEQYLIELTGYPEREFYRPNFFTNTPDILPFHLQGGEPWMFKARLALAATLSPTYGIYNGYELLEHEPIPIPARGAAHPSQPIEDRAIGLTRVRRKSLEFEPKLRPPLHTGGNSDGKKTCSGAPIALAMQSRTCPRMRPRRDENLG